MADKKAAIAFDYPDVLGAEITHTTLSGTVKVDGVGVSRNIVVFSDSQLTSINATTISDENGDFSVEVIGGKSDFVTIVCLNGGELYENSSIFAHISLAD